MKPNSEPKHSTDTWTLRWINIHIDAHKNLKMEQNQKCIDNQQLYMAEQENRKNELNWYDMQIYFTTRWPLAETHMHFREKKCMCTSIHSRMRRGRCTAQPTKQRLLLPCKSNYYGQNITMISALMQGV